MPEIAEERERRREGRADLDRAEVENAGAGATFEGSNGRRGAGSVEHLVAVLGRPQVGDTRGRDREREGGKLVSRGVHRRVALNSGEARASSLAGGLLVRGPASHCELEVERPEHLL